jgi:hypothetical protein
MHNGFFPFVIPGEDGGSHPREGDPGVAASLVLRGCLEPIFFAFMRRSDVDTWFPFPHADCRAIRVRRE